MGLCVALIAQLVEHLICNQGVSGSNPDGGTIKSKNSDIIQYLDVFIDIFIHLNTHPLMFTPPHPLRLF